jgi:hypothetical protein
VVAVHVLVLVLFALVVMDAGRLQTPLLATQAHAPEEVINWSNDIDILSNDLNVVKKMYSNFFSSICDKMGT